MFSSFGQWQTAHKYIEMIWKGYICKYIYFQQKYLKCILDVIFCAARCSCVNLFIPMLPFLLILCASVFSLRSSFIQNSVPKCFVDPHFLPVWRKDILTCPFLFCFAFFDCRLALIVSNFLGALRQTHRHLKGKGIIPHYYSSAFFSQAQQMQQRYYLNQDRRELLQLMQYLFWLSET